MNEINISVNIPVLVLIIITLLAIGVCCFLIGYLHGYKTSIGVSNIQNSKPKGFFDSVQENKQKKITIDNSTYVSDIKTDNLEKKYDKLGETKETEENISESINKLKNLKR